jgi:hypothetical protein
MKIELTKSAGAHHRLYRDLEIGAVFRFRNPVDFINVYIKTNGYEEAVLLKTGYAFAVKGRQEVVEVDAKVVVEGDAL